MMRYLLLLLLLPLTVVGQVPGSCEIGSATAVLNINQVEAGLTTHAKLFEHEGGAELAGPGYVVPKTRRCTQGFPGEAVSCSPVRLISPWFSGEIAGEVRMALSYYGRGDLWPGPLESGASLPNPTDCSVYDRIFVVSRGDVETYLRTGEAGDDLLDWPVQWGAPVLDGDGVPGNYDLSAGDQPAIYGEQTAWWIMNDVGNEHILSDTAPLGIEVQVTAFATTHLSVALQYTTYYKYRIINRNTHPIEDGYMAFLADLGGFGAYMGADTLRHMGYIYNAYASDSHYGIPPSFGVQVVQGPPGVPNGKDDDGDGIIDEPEEKLSMTGLVPFLAGPTGDPSSSQAFFWRMRGRWNDGTSMTEGGGGYQSGGPTTTFYFPGDPLEEAFWSAHNTDGAGQDATPGYLSFNINSGPFRLEPGEAVDVVIAIPFAQGTSHLDSVLELRNYADIIQNAWDLGLLEPTRVQIEAPSEVPGIVELSRPFPNPFGDELTIRYTAPEAMPVRIALYDLLGRELIRADVIGNAGEAEIGFDTSDLPGGIYIVHVEATGESRSFSVVKLR